VKLENIADFIIPLIILALFFFLNMQKKKEKAQTHEEPEQISRPQAPPRAAPRKQHVQRLNVEDRKLGNAIEERHPILSERGELASQHKKKKSISRASKLLKGTSLRHAFLLNEILKPPL
jgi:hypothetical protein